MRKTFLSVALAAAAFTLPAVAGAQDAAFSKGTRILSLGIMTGGDYEGFGGGGSFEVGLLEITPKVKLGIGGMIGYLRDSEDFGLAEYTLTQMPFMTIGNVHFEVPNQPKLDLYAGASVGIIRVSYSGDATNLPGFGFSDSDTDSGFGIQGGVRYSLGAKASVMGQVGVGDIPLLYAGVSFKF